MMIKLWLTEGSLIKCIKAKQYFNYKIMNKRLSRKAYNNISTVNVCENHRKSRTFTKSIRVYDMIFEAFTDRYVEQPTSTEMLYIAK